MDAEVVVSLDHNALFICVTIRVQLMKSPLSNFDVELFELLLLSFEENGCGLVIGKKKSKML